MGNRKESKKFPESFNCDILRLDLGEVCENICVYLLEQLLGFPASQFKELLELSR
jgi:hypothetical protein